MGAGGARLSASGPVHERTEMLHARESTPAHLQGRRHQTTNSRSKVRKGFENASSEPTSWRLLGAAARGAAVADLAFTHCTPRPLTSDSDLHLHFPVGPLPRSSAILLQCQPISSRTHTSPLPDSLLWSTAELTFRKRRNTTTKRRHRPRRIRDRTARKHRRSRPDQAGLDAFER